MKHRGLRLGFAAMGVTLAPCAVAQGPLGVPSPFLPMSRPGTVQTCPNDCRIAVTVTKDAQGKCEARVDVETVRVKKRKRFHWRIEKVDPSDTNTYSFVRDGIAWVDKDGLPTAPPSASEFVPESQNERGKAKWKTGDRPTVGEYHYLVVVEGPMGICKAVDPKIANDG